MNEKEIAEIRRRFRPDKNNIAQVHGCYVNEKREIVSEFHQSLPLMPQQEQEELLGTLKRTLSGTPGKNLLDISFETQQVVDSDEHRLLTALRDSGLGDGEAVRELFSRIAGALALEGNYLILLACDTYDVPFRGKDGQRQDDASDVVFSYFLCSVCPIRITKPALSYQVCENEFRNRGEDWLVGPPELGFLFPAFDDRCANLYGALYYSRSAAESHQEFADALFRRELPMPAQAQKETFGALLGETLQEDCSLEVVQEVHGRLREMAEEHKADPEAESSLTPGRAKRILTSCGVSEERAEEFAQKCTEEFGGEALLSPGNLTDTKVLEIRTPDVVIRVNPQRADLLETRVINGRKYLLIRADEGVEVNGVGVRIADH